jgi:hypothetical protein
VVNAVREEEEEEEEEEHEEAYLAPPRPSHTDFQPYIEIEVP